MRQESIKAFTARISQANGSELTVIIYDILIETTEEGIAFLKSGEEEEALHSFRIAQKCLAELMNSLYFGYGIAKQLFSLYSYMNKQYIETIRKKDLGEIPELLEMIRTMRNSFQEVAKQDKRSPLMENTQKIYAGLTYGRGTLNEIDLDVNSAKRGFMA